MKDYRRSLPHSINRQMPRVWIKIRGRQVLGAGLWVASRSPAPCAQGRPPFLHQRCLCAQTSPHAPSNDCTDQIQAHQPPHILYSPQQQRNWGKRRTHSHRTRRKLNSDQSNTHKVAKVWSACGRGLETINTRPGTGGLGYYPFLNRDTKSDRNVQDWKQWRSLIDLQLPAIPSCENKLLKQLKTKFLKNEQCPRLVTYPISSDNQ